ncbi:hypothetical protein NEOLEDRAFT_1127120 [Neolentinus lepideus HHB14362 ss-1]|uniref:Uncharacterized protein n=1 Tax=Neolentinus lepideus HHB14362 ss-1 TaxID=1314782 RepID=A0A165VUB7_9AGAM|nr:hypothetical protein NEOLEDRAFT_1127120 [Neolentinus lepideus HHB14362 ss-1]
MARTRSIDSKKNDKKDKMVLCNCEKCKGSFVTKHTARTHATRDHRRLSRAKTLEKQVAAAGPGASHSGSIRDFSVRLTEPTRPDPFLDFAYTIPRLTSSSAVEQEMLDSGVLSPLDLEIQTYGSVLPNLGPYIHAPEQMLDLVGHFEHHNALAASYARPLMPHDAHMLPYDPDAMNLEREFQAMFISEMEAASQRPDTGGDEEEDDDDDIPELPVPPEWLRDDTDVPVDAQADILDDAESDEGEEDPSPDAPQDISGEPAERSDQETVLVSEPAEDINDPFHDAHCISEAPSVDIQDLQPHLLCIYALVSWLHLQFHLPRIACNAVLAIIACLLYFVSPNIEAPYITLKAVSSVAE